MSSVSYDGPSDASDDLSTSYASSSYLSTSSLSSHVREELAAPRARSTAASSSSSSYYYSSYEESTTELDAKASPLVGPLTAPISNNTTTTNTSNKEEAADKGGEEGRQVGGPNGGVVGLSSVAAVDAVFGINNIGFRMAMFYVFLAFVIATAVIAGFLVLPLADPEEGFKANWLYLAVYVPCNIFMVAFNFDQLITALMPDKKRSGFMRCVGIGLYVVLNTALIVGFGAVFGFPSGLTFLGSLISLAVPASAYFSFEKSIRSEASFWPRYKAYLFVIMINIISFNVFIAFVWIFPSLKEGLHQMVMLACLGFLNVMLRILLLNLGERISPRHGTVAAFQQDFLADLTMNMVLPNIKSVSVFTVSVFINLAPHVLGLLLHMEWAIGFKESLLVRWRGEKVMYPIYPISTYTSFEAAQLSARRELHFKAFFLVALCEVYATIAYIALLPVIAYGPQNAYFPFMVKLRCGGDCLIGLALRYAGITLATELAFTGVVTALLVHYYFPNTYRVLVRESVMLGVRDFYLIVSAQATVYVLALAILGTHFGAHKSIPPSLQNEDFVCPYSCAQG